MVEINKMTYDEALTQAGWLSKKSSSVFGGFQKRFFTISPENKLLFSDSKGGKCKGILDLDFAKVTGENENSFKITIGDKEFLFKAESSDEKNKWINSLNTLFSHQKKATGASFTSMESVLSNKRTFEAPGDSSDIEISRKCLEIKGINNFIDKLPKELIETRIIYGFLQKRHKSTVETFQKRWYFLISPRPLNQSLYNSDDISLDPNCLPPNILFDTLYYYKVESEYDRSESVGKIELMDSKGVELLDKDQKFYILIDVNGRKFELVAENTVDRKKWFEALKYSSLTAKDYKNSISKRPRNIAKIANQANIGGMHNIKEICLEEKKKLLTSLKQENSTSLENLTDLFETIEKHLFETIDGCLLFTPPCIEILKIYVDIMNNELLDKFSNYFASEYLKLNNQQLITLGCLLYNFEEKLSEFGIIDPNFSLNGRELFKIFSKKYFIELKNHLDYIMKQERDLNIINENDVLITILPEKLFKFILDTYDYIKNNRIKQLYEFFLIDIKDIILNYVIASDCIINQYNYMINIDYMISISNNTSKISSLIDDLIISITKENVLQNNEVFEFLRKTSITNSLNILFNNSIIRIVFELYGPVINIFSAKPFLMLSLDKNIFPEIKEIFEKIEKSFYSSHKKIFWTQIFQNSLEHYINCFLSSGIVNCKQIDEIKFKLETDKNHFINFFQSNLEKFILNDIIRILEDFLEIMSCQKESLPNFCFKIRKLHGNNFSFLIAKALLNLRVDMTLNNKQVAVLEIKELFEKNPLIDSNIQRNNSKLLSLINEILIDKVEKREVVFNERRRFSKTLSEHLKDQSSKPDENEDNDLNYVNYNTMKTEKTNVDIEVISGYLKKKSYTVWQEKYFVIKNSFLYWYKSQDSKEHQNYFSLVDCKKVQSYKTTKFLIMIEDKIYKFECGTEENKNNWINCLNSELKKIKDKVERNVENIYQVKMRKKQITDLSKYPNVSCDITQINLSLEGTIQKEPQFFKEKHKRVEVSQTESSDFSFKEKSSSQGLNLDFGFISNQKKQRNSIFSCCSKCLKFFKKKKRYNEFEEK